MFTFYKSYFAVDKEINLMTDKTQNIFYLIAEYSS